MIGSTFIVATGDGLACGFGSAPAGGDSWKKPELQPLVMRDVVHQIREGNRSVVGVMIESFLEAGTQPIPADLSQLRYGCSVTDACVSWDTTEEMLLSAHEVLRGALTKRRAA